MPSALDLQPDGRFVGLFVGKSGSGKTVAAASFPKPMEVLDFDMRIRGLLGAPWVNRQGINYTAFPPRTSEEGKTNLQILNQLFEAWQVQAKTGQLNIKTIILDSLTSECFAFLQDAIPLTHKGEGNRQKGKHIGTLAMPGPEDYGFEANGTYQVLAFLRSLPVQNVIVSAHVVDRYGKPTLPSGDKDTYAENIVIGEKLSIRDKIAENSLIYFDHVFRFDRLDINGRISHEVKFRSDLARTAFAELPDKLDITKKSFYETMMSYLKKPEPVQV